MKKFLSDKKVYLRGITKDDCNAQYFSFVNNVETLSFVEGIGFKPLNKQDLQAYIEECSNSASLLLGIFENGTDIHVGNIHLSQIKPYHNNCSCGIVLNKEYMGKGYAYEACVFVIKHAFEKINVHRIQITVIEKNEEAIKLYKKLGAVEEGKLREAFYLNNKYYDVIVNSILKQEYFNKKDRSAT